MTFDPDRLHLALLIPGKQNGVVEEYFLSCNALKNFQLGVACQLRCMALNVKLVVLFDVLERVQPALGLCQVVESENHVELLVDHSDLVLFLL